MRTYTGYLGLWAIGCLLAAAACGGGSTTTDDGGGDAATDLAVSDMSGHDSGGFCTLASECDDGVYCNGVERCTPTAAGADAHGCAAGTPPCPAAACHEATRSCASSCPDADGDGHSDSACGGDDCNDADPHAFPGNLETCDHHDEDCNPTTIGPDADGDGQPSIACCNGTTCGTDCDDARSTVHLGAVEACNGIDDDCNGIIDDGVQLTFYRDVDGDGYGVTADTAMGCSLLTGYAFNPGDCADMVPAIHPGAVDACNMLDDDCDGIIDPGCACTTGHTQMCGEPDGTPGGFVSTGECAVGTQTCIDGTWGVCTGAVLRQPEVCNMLDDDCDGNVDNGVDRTCYADVDGDGYAAAGTPGTQLCPSPDPSRTPFGGCAFGYTNRMPVDVTTIDCADAMGYQNVHPGGVEVCNDLDDDCNGTPDDGTGAKLTCYVDNDGDGYAATGAATSLACVCPARTTSRAPVGMANIDCDDTMASSRPGLSEICDPGMNDENCDGNHNEGCTCTPGMTRGCPDPGVCHGGTESCVSMGVGAGWGTCSIAPVMETCDGLDNDCDTFTDNGFTCQLGAMRACTTNCGGVMSSGTQTCLTDCSNFGACNAAEVCNGCDDNLDGTPDNAPGFTCVRGAVSGCTTACTTPGMHTCDATCAAYGACHAATETCNFCDDVGDGGDDRAVGSTHMADDIMSCGTPPPTIMWTGAASCPYVNSASLAAPGIVTWVAPAGAPVRVGWDAVSASTRVLMTDTADAFAPNGTLTLYLETFVSVTTYHRVQMVWDVNNPESVSLQQVTYNPISGVSTATNIVTWPIATVGWTAFDAGSVTTYPISIEYIPALGAASSQQVRFTIGTSTSSWQSWGSPGVSWLGIGASVSAGLVAAKGSHPWLATMPGGTDCQIRALDTCN